MDAPDRLAGLEGNKGDKGQWSSWEVTLGLCKLSHCSLYSLVKRNVSMLDTMGFDICLNS